ncbi:MAG: hypothetical protein K9H34_11085 [Actinomycetia bacterium]|nr:hypothetical protein [Actinomycetes bacterium]
MSSVTAIIAIGSMHPNDGCINPSHIALLHEGHRAAWTLHDLSEHPEARRKWMPEFPDLIAQSLIIEILPLCEGTAISATIFEGSSLRAEDLQVLTDRDVEISRPTWSRIYSGWSNDWTVTNKES